MSGPDAVWPDGAREAVVAAHDRWMDRPSHDPTSVDHDILTALEPFVQQRIEAALSDIDELVPPAIGIYQTIPDRVRLVIAQRDEAWEDVRLYREEADRLRAEVARLREDGERRQAEVLQLRALVAALPIGECQASAALQGWWDQMKAVMAGTNPVWLVEPRGCPTPGACSCPGVRLDAARSARGGEG